MAHSHFASSQCNVVQNPNVSGNGALSLTCPYNRISHFGCELIVPSPHRKVRTSQNARIGTGNNEFASEMRNPNVSGSGP